MSGDNQLMAYAVDYSGRNLFKVYFKNLEKLLAKKEVQIRQKVIEKERIIDLYQQGTLTEGEIRNRIEGIKNQITQQEREIELLTRESNDKKTQLRLIDDFEEFSKKVIGSIKDIDFAKRKRIVQMLIDEVKINVKNHEINIKHIIPLPKKSQLSSGSQRQALLFSKRLLSPLQYCHKHPRQGPPRKTNRVYSQGPSLKRTH